MDIEYFIKKFEAIPDEKWTVKKLYDPITGQCCVLGHCGGRVGWINGEKYVIRPPEMISFIRLFPLRLSSMPIDVNNGDHPDFQQTTPKARILAALEYLKGVK